jgi:hypothetical protein
MSAERSDKQSKAAEDDALEPVSPALYEVLEDWAKSVSKNCVRSLANTFADVAARCVLEPTLAGNVVALEPGADIKSGNASKPALLNEPRMLEAPDLPDNGADFQPGQTVEQADGSKILYERCADGRVRPKKLTYANDHYSEYGYNATGTLSSVVNRDKEQRLLSRISASDNGQVVTLTAGGEVLLDNGRGKLHIRADGTWKLVTADESWQSCPDGSLMHQFKAGDNVDIRKIVLPDSSSVQERKRADGKFHPFQADFQDGTIVRFLYTDDGRPLRIIESKPGAATVIYHTPDSGNTWTKTVKTGDEKVHQQISGSLAFLKDYRPIFKESGDKVVEVGKNYEPRTERQKEQARILTLQESFESCLTRIYAAKLHKKTDEITKSYIDESLKKSSSNSAHSNQTQLSVEELTKRVDVEVQKLKQEKSMIEQQLKAEQQIVKREMEKPNDRQLPSDKLWEQLPMTRKVFGNTIDWLEKEAVPVALKQQSLSANGDIPPNSPHPVPKHAGTRFFEDTSYYRSLAASGEFTNCVRLGIAVQERPNEQSLEKIKRAIEWVGDVEEQAKKQQLDYETRVLLPSIVKQMNLPEAWLREYGDNPTGKRAAMKEMLDIAWKLRSYTAALMAMKLNEEGEGPVFFMNGTRKKLPLPPYCELVKGDNGKIAFSFDWPESLKLNEANNIMKIEAYKKWLGEHGAKVDEAIAACVASLEPRKRLFYGEIPGEVFVKLDGGGKLSEILDPIFPDDSPAERARKEKALEGAKRGNLLSSDFTIEEKNGKLFVQAILQAKESHIYNYLNILADPIGLPSIEHMGPLDEQGKPKGFTPEALVAVRGSDGQLHVVPANDLKTWKGYQQFTYWGGKSTAVVMDVGMTVAGIGTGGGSAIAWNAGKISGAAALRMGIPAMVRASLGASGFLLNNAEAQSTSTGQWANEVRGALMMADVALGTIRPAAGLFGMGKSLEAEATRERIEEALCGSNLFVRGTIKPLYMRTEHDKYSRPYHRLMNLTNGFYVPALASEVQDHIETLSNLGKPNPFLIAMDYTEKGRDTHEPSQKFENILDKHREHETTKLLDQCLALLAQRKGISSNDKEILQNLGTEARNLLHPQLPERLAGPDCPEQDREQWRADKKTERERFKAKLLDYFYGDGEQVAQQIAQANEGKSVSQKMPDNTIRVLQAKTFNPNSDLQTAAAALLLLLSTDQAGKVPADGLLTKRTLSLPAHTMFERVSDGIHQKSGETRYKLVNKTGPANATQDIRVSDIVEILRKNVTQFADRPAIKVLSADLLVRLSERSQLSYAAVLCDSLNHPNATSLERASALAQLAQMVGAQRLIESNWQHFSSPSEHQNYLAYSYGLTSRDLLAELEKYAGARGADKNLRALSAALIADLGKTIEPEELNRLIEKRINDCHRFLSGENEKQDSYVDVVLANLKQDLKSADAAAHLRAALSLRSLKELGPYEGEGAKLSFNAEMVQIALMAGKNGIFQSSGARAIEEMDLTGAEPLSRGQLVSLRGILEDYTSSNNALLKLMIAKRAHEIAQSPEEKQLLAETLSAHVTYGHRLFAEKFPELRLNTIHALGKLGVSMFCPVLATCIRSPEDGKEPYRHYEPDARIRLAALNALVLLRARGLDRLLTDSFEKETDAAVRARLLECKSQTFRPIADWTWFHERDRMASRATESSRDSIENAVSWLQGLEGPLRYRGFKDGKEVPIDKAVEKGIPVPSAEIEKIEAQYEMRTRRISDGLGAIYAKEPVHIGNKTFFLSNPAYGEFFKALDKQVFDVARENSENGHEARMALIYLVLRNGDPFKGDDTSAGRKEVVDRALLRVIELMHPGSSFRGELLPGVLDILADPMINPTVRSDLLKALQRHLLEDCLKMDSKLLLSLREAAAKFEGFNRELKNVGLLNDDGKLSEQCMSHSALRNKLLMSIQVCMKQNAEFRSFLEKKEVTEGNANSTVEYRIMLGQCVSDALVRDLTHVNQVSRGKGETYRNREMLRLQMLELIGELKPYQALKTLEAVSIIKDKGWISNNESFQNRAKEVLADIRDSVKIMWEDKNFPTQNGTLAQRTEVLQAALAVPVDGAQQMNSYAIAEAMFLATKGMPIVEPNDTRTDFIRLALNNEGSRGLRKVEDSANLAARMVNPAGQLESDAGRNQKEQNGSEQVSFAAALIILDSANNAFNEADRRKALDVVSRLAFQGVEYGYRRDAMDLLVSHLKGQNNRFALFAVRDRMLENNSVADSVIELNGKQYSLRKLLEENFKAETGEVGTGIKLLKSASGEVNAKFERDRLIAIEETKSTGQTVQMRLLPGNKIVIERFQDGKLKQALPPTGTTYAEVLRGDFEGLNTVKPEERLSSAVRLLSGEEGIDQKVTEQQRTAALKAIQRIAEQNLHPLKVRLAAAEYLLKDKGDIKCDSPFLGAAISSLVDMAWAGDGKASSLLMALRSAEKERALAYLSARLDLHLAACAEKERSQRDSNIAVQRIAAQLESKSRDLADRLRSSIPDNNLVARDSEQLTHMLTLISDLASSVSPSHGNDALLFKIYSQATSRVVRAENNLTRLKPLVGAAAQRIKSDPIKNADDPRLPYASFETFGNGREE